MRVAVLVSGAGTNLQALLDRVHGREGVEIVAVGSSRGDAPALDRAAAAAVPGRAFPLADFAGRAERDAALAGWLAELGVELVVLAGYIELLTPAFLLRWPERIVNVHPSLLPAFPGLRAVEQALEYGVKVVGVTVHFVDEGVDSGPVIMQRAIEVPAGAGAEAVTGLLHEVEHELLPESVRLLARGSVSLDAANPRVVLVG